MPQGEKYWNPYRWVELGDEPVRRESPRYHHRMEGLSGRIECALTALTPLMIGDGHGQFVRHKHNNQPYIPATSLKGNIRALAELIGNAAIPFPKTPIDSAHKLSQAREERSGEVHYDIVARTFGFLDGQLVFGGVIQFGDGEVRSMTPVGQWPEQSVAVGQPKPAHKSFYPDDKRRKLYHHRPGADRLTTPHAGITQTNSIRPAPAGTVFAFTVDFRNIGDEELALLLYCLALEEVVTVTLGPSALGPDARDSRTITGPLRHKIGGCKPHGGGSAHITIERMTVRTDPADRYRGTDLSHSFEGESLQEELRRRTAHYRARTDRTMQELRAMMVYCPDDPRRPVIYPTYQWFQEDKQLPLPDKRQLKSTL